MTIGTFLAAGIAGAGAQSSAPATFAAVDDSGRVVPIEAPAQPVEILQGRKGAASPCAPATDLASDAAKALIERVATEEKFYPDFVLSVAKIESRYLSTALSEKGAYGLMQLTPDTAQRFGVDLCDPEGNVRGGVRFLRALHERYRNPFFILAAYNAGEAAVQKSRGVPPFPETVRFVADVMNDFYTWPDPAGAATASAARVASARADIIQPLSGGASLAAGRDRWLHQIRPADRHPADQGWRLARHLGRVFLADGGVAGGEGRGDRKEGRPWLASSFIGSALRSCSPSPSGCSGAWPMRSSSGCAGRHHGFPAKVRAAGHYCACRMP
ncbi:MAG TPA: lytic transglycosylase domain-containing protein, partial [Reyranella sp.]|nr:lytic transglycosylase domain-containing protein [Reyranella sp.]